jgi:RNA 2',3'-cyclic 3'-phosphodiesterase
VRPEALHVTLVFLGYQPEKQVDAIAGAAFGALEGHGPARLTPADVKPLPPRRPRLFALDLEDEDGRASAVQAAAQQALVAGRWYRPEKRPFWPHMTLARVKRDRRAQPLPVLKPPPGPFDASDVVLYQSTLRPQGAEYTPLSRFRLSG